MNLSLWYFLTKFLAYSFWMWYGLGRVGRAHAGRIPIALMYGFARLSMGLGIGLFIWLAGSWMTAKLFEAMPERRLLAEVLTYAAVYVPIRWIEWAVFDLVIDSHARTVRGFLFGPTAGSRAWRLGGILISCLADIVVIADVGGLPVGRFMCDAMQPGHGSAA
jgi:hypothetical protein